MELNKAEIKMFNKIKKFNKEWKRLRWLSFIVAVPWLIVLTFRIPQAYKMIETPGQQAEGTLSLLIFFSLAVVLFVNISISIAIWNGKPKDILLVKLVEANLDKSEE